MRARTTPPWSITTLPAPTTGKQEQQWVNEDADANPGGTSGWYFSNGTVATDTNCNQTHYCSLDEAQAALVAQNDGGPAATIKSIAIGKGTSDPPYQGAADALQINDVIYDFEPFGVSEVDATP